MTYEIQWEKKIASFMLAPLFGSCALVLTVAMFHVPSAKGVIVGTFSYFMCYYFSVIANRIIVEDSKVIFARIVGKKLLLASDILSVRKNKFLGVVIFKSTNGSVWVLKEFPKLNEVIDIIKSTNSSVEVKF
jgi:hypothetical protein